MPGCTKIQIVSIPRSGFCSFKHRGGDNKIEDRHVSIPRSGFCSFKLMKALSKGQYKGGFNPSVGILFIQALRPFPRRTRAQPVSIPRSGFCSFKPQSISLATPRMWCFNPSVGILFIQAVRCACCTTRVASFNPSVGILFIQANHRGGQRPDQGPFQSLGRDSVHSSWLPLPVGPVLEVVSIPRSGFCSFKRSQSMPIVPVISCFNPSVGILFIQAYIPPSHQ